MGRMGEHVLFKTGSRRLGSKGRVLARIENLKVLPAWEDACIARAPSASSCIAFNRLNAGARAKRGTRRRTSQGRPRRGIVRALLGEPVHRGSVAVPFRIAFRVEWRP